MKKLYAIHVKGNHKTWVFGTMLDPKYYDDYWEDGLRVFEVCNIIPSWYVDAGLPLGIFCFFQNLILGGGK